MNSKKGFTLIELLAVIVILAIIALIATPLVLKYIEKSRQESKVDSAYSFVRNLETEIANYSIKNNGKKYNGQPSDKGYYELDSFNGSEIDTTVKGDKPNSIKVCLSSLGQVEKAMFEYGKYYVSYDDKKGSISDKDTYDSFSCSGNDMIGAAIFDKTINFSYNSDFGGYIGMDIGDYSGLEINYGDIYYISIDNGDYVQLIGTNDNLLIEETFSTLPFAMVSAEGFAVLPGYQLENQHHVKLIKSDKKFIDMGDYRFAISGNNIWIHSSKFIEGPAEVTIIDSDGVTYPLKGTVDGKINFTTSTYLGIPFYGKHYIEVNGNLFDAAISKKDIIVTVKQNIDGKVVDETLSLGSANGSLYKYKSNYYYWGNPYMPCVS